MTREERHEVYKKALENLKHYNTELQHNVGLCFHLTVAGKVNAYGGIERTYPEVFLHKPEMGWWPYENQEIRIKVLEDCIEKTKQ